MKKQDKVRLAMSTSPEVVMMRCGCFLDSGSLSTSGLKRGTCNRAYQCPMYWYLRSLLSGMRLAGSGTYNTCSLAVAGRSNGENGAGTKDKEVGGLS